jgi:UDP-glucuronate 4-epimerase
MKAILITGVAGFIGARVAEFLLDEGETVVGVDNFSEYYDPRLKHHRLEQFHDREGFTFHRADITDPETMQSVFDHREYSAVIHLAGMAGIRDSRNHPLAFERTNVGGTALLLRLIHTYHVPTLVFASSSSVYAGNIPPFQEDMKTDAPASVYAATKKSAEMLIASDHAHFDLNCAILRYFSVYGPQGRPDMSYFRFIRAIAENQPIHIYGDGTQKRDFTYIDDIVRGTIHALKVRGMHICNLANGESSHSVHDLIEIIEDRLKKKAVRIYEESDVSDLPITQADTAYAQKVLQWKPLVSFTAGMEATIEWYRVNRNFIQSLKNG